MTFRRYQALCRLIFLQSLIGPHFEPGLSLRLDAAWQDLEALEGRRRGGPVRVGGVVRRVVDAIREGQARLFRERGE